MKNSLIQVCALTVATSMVCTGFVATAANPANAEGLATANASGQDPGWPTLPFNYQGAPQTWTVPDGVQKLGVNADGGGGDAGQSGDVLGKGGAGGSPTNVVAAVPVTPGEKLIVRVGGYGSGQLGGYNGGGAGGAGGLTTEYGGGGGGASDIYTASGVPLLVAAGGGGGGGAASTGSTGGAGGSGTTNAAGSAGAAGQGSEGTGGAGGKSGKAASRAGTPGQAASSSFTGSGGGGGGGYAGGAGAKSGSYKSDGTFSEKHYGAGGGGGTGTSYVAPGSAKVQYYKSVTQSDLVVTWIGVTTPGLADGLIGQPYSQTLTANTFLEDPEWSVVGSLPAGLSLSPDPSDPNSAILSGTPTTTFNGNVTFAATGKMTGAVTYKTFPLDIVGFDPTGIAVLDQAASNIGLRSASANGKVYRNTPQALSSIYCKYSTSPDTSAGTVVAATPSSAVSGSAPVDVSCNLANLSPNTKYYYNLYAVTGSTTVDSNSPQSFTTSPLGTQTAKVPFPKRIKFKGRTVVLPRKIRTNDHKVLKVRVKVVAKPKHRHGRLYQVIRKHNRFIVKTYGNASRWRLKLIYQAAGNADVKEFRQFRIYKVARHN